jgi:hypothetical protein
VRKLQEERMTHTQRLEELQTQHHQRTANPQVIAGIEWFRKENLNSKQVLLKL